MHLDVLLLDNAAYWATAAGDAVAVAICTELRGYDEPINNNMDIMHIHKWHMCVYKRPLI